MIDTEQTIFTAPGVEMIEKPFDETAEILASYLVTQEYWIWISDAFGIPAITTVMDRFYGEEASEEDRFAVLVPFQGEIFGVFVLKRALMTSEQFQFALRKHGLSKTRRELVSEAAQIRVATWNMQRAEDLAAKLGLEIIGDDLAVSE